MGGSLTSNELRCSHGPVGRPAERGPSTERLTETWPHPNSDQNQCNELANQRTLRGIALLEENTPASLAAALSCFDEAIALRQDLPLAENPWIRYGLVAGWMNRADALTRLGSPVQLAEAMHSYDLALEHLQHLPPEEDPQFLRRHVIAWANRGLTLQAQTRLDEALRSFDQALALLKNTGPSLLLAGIWLNRGNVLMQTDPPFPLAAKNAAQSALAAIGEWEASDLQAAETGLKARLLLCQATAHLLPGDPALLSETTDAVEEGMRLAHHWEERDGTRLEPLAAALFHFGSLAYGRHQPQFLADYLLENLAQKPGWRSVARSVLHRLIQEIQRGDFAGLNTPRFAVTLERFRHLRLTTEKLAATL